MSDNFEKDSDSLWEKTKDTAGEAWEATKEFSGKAWDKTKEVSSDAWEATKNGAQKVSNAFSDNDEEVEKAEFVEKKKSKRRIICIQKKRIREKIDQTAKKKASRNRREAFFINGG